jgi:hypothetical protein
MDAQATSSLDGMQANPFVVPLATSCPAKQLRPTQRQDLAVQVLAGVQPVSELARQHQVSRKFLYRQAETAADALEHAFDPPPANGDVLFYLPVTKAWLRQLILALVLIGHCSYRGVIALLRDLFDTKISVGTVHNVVEAAVAPARQINRSSNLAGIRVGAHDEIFQASQPVLVGVDTASTFCYLLSLEEHRDADTWGVRLLELADRGFAPEATVADFGTGLRAGQKLALPAVPCRGDLFHLMHDLEQILGYLENRGYDAIDVCTRLEREQTRERRQCRPTDDVAQRLRQARTTCETAIALADDIRLLRDWLRHDVLAVAGPSHADRCALYDFLLAELRVRVPSCPHRLGPIYRTLKNRRDDLLSFALVLDEKLEAIAARFEAPPQCLRRLLGARSRLESDLRRWAEEAAVRKCLGGQFLAACEAIDGLIAGTVRASSLVENLNSRLRNYFTLRRHLGSDYLSLLQFFLNHRVLERSDRGERQGKTPAELLTGQTHPHWLEMLGFSRFKRD